MKGLQKLERIKKLSCVWDADNDEFKNAVEIVPNAFETIEKELKALNEILILYDKWLGNEMSEFEFFTLLSEIKDKYGLSKEVLKDEQ